jgi:hypothetical protein
MKLCCFLTLLVILSTTLVAQRLVEREVIINPMFTELPLAQRDSLRWMSSVSAWGGFGFYAIGDREHEWQQKLGILIELFRLGNHASFSFESHIGLIANDRNDIRFNPSALIWEEGFMYTWRLNQSFLQIGYFHRCKHDVDNLIEGHERTLIFGGLLFKYILPIAKQSTHQETYLALRTELYTIRQDTRIPDKFMELNPNLKQLLGTVALNLNNRKSLSRNFGVYLNAYASLNFFGINNGFLNRFNSLQTVHFNGGVSTGFAIQGGAHFRIGLNVEYFSDNMIDPFPKSSLLLSLGILIIDPKAML